MVIAHGYYVPRTRRRHGDRNLATIAAVAWRKLGHRVPARCATAACFVRSDGTLTIRIVANDLFGMATACYPPSAPFVVPRYLQTEHVIQLRHE